MKCPHCRIEIHSNELLSYIDKDVDGNWFLSKMI